MFHVKHLIVDRHSSAHLRQVFITSHTSTSHLTPHTQRPMFHVKHPSLLKLTPQPHPSRSHYFVLTSALRAFDMPLPRSPMFHVKTLIVGRHSSAPSSPGFSLHTLTSHTLASHTQCPMFHVKHLIITRTPPSTFTFTIPYPLSPRTFTFSDVSRETPVLPQECKRAAASPRKVTPPPIPYDAHADTAGKHRPIPTPPA